MLWLGGITNVKGQQSPQYTQYFFHTMAMNPGYAGSENRICATLIHRDQWAGLTDGPETSAATIHSNLNRRYIQGIGIHLLNDQIGPLSNQAFSLSLAHRLFVGPGELGIGLNVGGFQRSLSGDFFPPEFPAIDDPTIPTDDGSSMVPDFGLGLYYQAANWYAGLSSQHLHEPLFDDWGGDQNIIYRVFYLTGGYNFDVTENITLRPMSLVKFDRAKVQIDVTGQAVFGDRLWAGLSYRYQDAVALHAGLRLLDQLRVGYSYDITTSEISGYSSGSHEFMLSYCFRITIREDQPIIIRTPRFL